MLVISHKRIACHYGSIIYGAKILPIDRDPRIKVSLILGSLAIDTLIILLLIYEL